jgi:hypothetical protein
MASYPTFPQLTSAPPPVNRDDLAVDEAMNGGVKARAYFAAVKHRFTIHHVLNATDYATLVSFYNANRLLSFSFTFQRNGGTAYPTCIFAAPIKELTQESPGLVRVEVTIFEQ